MHMKKVSLDDREPAVLGENLQRRGLSEPLETTNLALKFILIWRRWSPIRLPTLRCRADTTELS